MSYVMLTTLFKAPYDQFILFGDSLTQQSCSQERGFAFMPALQDGKLLVLLSFHYHYHCLKARTSDIL